MCNHIGVIFKNSHRNNNENCSVSFFRFISLDFNDFHLCCRRQSWSQWVRYTLVVRALCQIIYENDFLWSFVERDSWQTCQFINYYYDADSTKIRIFDREWPSMDLSALTLTLLIPGWKHWAFEYCCVVWPSGYTFGNIFDNTIVLDRQHWPYQNNQQFK